jgi:hypothetical protein
MDALYPWSGQDRCFDAFGAEVPCPGSGQDGEYHPGRQWPVPRFAAVEADLIQDRLTGLVWPRRADLAEWPMSHGQAQNFVNQCNRDGLFGRADWRIPRRRELLSLTSLAHARPALPPGHPFVNVFQHWHWTATVSAVAPDHIWRVNLEGGRMFSGPAHSEHLLWPVAGESWLLPESGAEGLRSDRPWPHPRFQASGREVHDGLTGLTWHRLVLPEAGETTWSEALKATQGLGGSWRLPTIWELESLVDVAQARPALTPGHPFEGFGQETGQTADQGLWSSTSSGFDPAWAWVLYVSKGAVGVGHKPGRHFKYLLTRGQGELGIGPKIVRHSRHHTNANSQAP